MSYGNMVVGSRWLSKADESETATIVQVKEWMVKVVIENDSDAWFEHFSSDELDERFLHIGEDGA